MVSPALAMSASVSPSAAPGAVASRKSEIAAGTNSSAKTETDSPFARLVKPSASKDESASASKAKDKSELTDSADSTDKPKPDAPGASPSDDTQTLVGLIQTSLMQMSAAGTPGGSTLPANSAIAGNPNPASVPGAVLQTSKAGAALPPPKPGSGSAAAAKEDVPFPEAAIATPTAQAGLQAGKPIADMAAAKSLHESVSEVLPVSLATAVATAVAAAGVDPSAQSAGAAMQTASAVAGVPDAASGTLATPATSTAPQPQTSTLDAGELPQRLDERLRWLIDDGVQEARLQLHPADLGSIHIRVRVDDVGTARVWFAAEHPAARAALETALPQLRERFASDGLDLQSSAVSAQGRGWDSQRQSPSSARFAGVSATAVDDTAETVHSTAASSRSAVHDGLIDRYA